MKQTFKDYYKLLSLIAVILLFAILIFSELTPFLGGFLGAFTVYVIVRRQMIYLNETKKLGKNLSAIIVLLEVILCILLPTFLIIWLVVGNLSHYGANIQPSELFNVMQRFVSVFQERTGYDLLSQENITKATSYFSMFLQTLVGQISYFVVNAVVLLFALYFMLIGNREMETFIYDLLPFNESNKRIVLDEVKRMVTSNAVGIPILAILQGAIATLGYYFFDVPNPVLFGFLTCFASIIPIVGTGFLWAPLVLFLALSGNWQDAIGLLIYALLVISNVDNLFRFMLQKKLADVHPLITVFGAIAGLTLFGFWGVIFGPLMLSMFFVLVNIFKNEYLKA